MGAILLLNNKYGKDFYISYDYESNTFELLSKNEVSGAIKDSIKNTTDQLSNNGSEVYTLKLANLSDPENILSEFTSEPVKKEQSSSALSGETNNAIYTINKMYVVDNSMFEGKKVLVLEMTFTNKQQQASSPWMTFALDYAAQQTDGTTTVELMGANGQMANVENQEAVEMGDANVNPGATVEAVIGYDYTNPESVVNFILRSSMISGQPKGFVFDPNKQ